MTSKNYIAIDIAKDSLAVCSDTVTGSFSYDNTGLGKLLDLIAKTQSPVVVCEATGGYERELVNRLHEQGIAVAVVNPARVRAFACSDGLKAKTDPIDAALLLRFARNKQVKPTPAPSAQQQRLQALMDRRSQLTESLAREKNRVQKSPKCILKSIEKMIRLIEKEIAAIEKQIKELIQADEQMRQKDDIIQAVDGVAKVTSWSILAYLQEINELNRNKLVSLVGVAPFNKDSGKYKGKRKIEGGRAKVRKCLYMAAQSAAIHNPHIKAYVEGLRARGKAYRCAIVAAMRKLIIHIQSELKKTDFSVA